MYVFQLRFCSALASSAPTYVVVMYDDEDGHHDGHLRLRLSAVAAYWTGLDWNARRFEGYVLDGPNAEREREEVGKVLLRLLFFAKNTYM